MELEKNRLVGSITSYFTISVCPNNNHAGVVSVFTGMKDKQKSEKKNNVQLFSDRKQSTSMGGHCSCLRPQQKRIPCVHLIHFASRVNFGLNKLFREEHFAYYWRWQYEGMGEEWNIPEIASLDSSSTPVSSVIGAPLRERPKKGKRKKSFLEMRKKKIKN